MLAFQDVYFLTGVAAFAMLPLVLIMQQRAMGTLAGPTQCRCSSIGADASIHS